MRLRAAPALALGALAALAACEHARPFGPADLGPNQPFSTGNPQRLTFSLGSDLTPAWLPDGSGIIYSYLRMDHPDGDRCLGVLPAEGGRQIRTLCPAHPVGSDSSYVFWRPAVGPGGELAYVRQTSMPGALAPSHSELVVASLAAPDSGHVVLQLPFVGPDGILEQTVTELRWTDQRTLYYLAEDVGYLTDTFPADTVLTPVEVVRLTLGGDTAAVAPLPATAGATSFALVGSDTLYLTFPGDSVVSALAIDGTTRSVVYDFGPLGPVTGVQLAGGRLFVVAGPGVGRANSGTCRCAHLGGVVYVFDPAGGSVQPLVPLINTWYRHGVASPSGQVVAAEGYPVTYRVRYPNTENSPVDTTVSRLSNLWLLKRP